MKPLTNNFFSKNPEIVARKLLGKILIRKLSNQTFKAKIVETEAYLGEKDPASRASKGKNKVSELMWSSPGTIMIYNVHKYKMLNFVTGKSGEPSAVLIRAVEPLNFKARTNGPGLLTESLNITKYLHGKNITNNKHLCIINNSEKHEILKGSRIGVTKDLSKPLRFYIKDNDYVSRK
ncbi:MAG: DNA-3-methyladenine glycosylase [Nanoarchaeota archaeon]|nr:DNA-3-methyladenine glycosylase [Nanoarchaeota archaeon]